jgi:(p)ppGpp synthase/HD superfamily hydrolase
LKQKYNFNVKKISGISRKVIVGGERNIPVKFAKCCSPSESSKIGGFVTRGSSVTIHKRDCKLYRNHDSKRHISASWDGVED